MKSFRPGAHATDPVHMTKVSTHWWIGGTYLQKGESRAKLFLYSDLDGRENISTAMYYTTLLGSMFLHSNKDTG